MTNPTSYAFSSNIVELPLHLVGESKMVVQITVSDTLIVIRLSSVITDESGSVSEEMIEERVITLHVNASGDKYVRAVEMDSSGGESEWPFDVSRHNVLSKFGMDNEAKAVVNKAIGNWLGLKSQHGLLDKYAPWSFYPALRGLSEWGQLESGDWYAERRINNLMTPLAMVASRTGRIVEALRDNSDWRSFVGSIIKESTVESNTQLTLVSADIHEELALLDFAVLDTGIPFSTLLREEKEVVRTYAESLTMFNKQAIHLMLEFLPANAKVEATRTILMMVKEWKKVISRNGNIYNHQRQPLSAFSDAFARVPETLKSILALEFFEHLQQKSSTIQAELTEYHEAPAKFLPINFARVYSAWFYDFVFQPSIVSVASSADVVELQNALFGVEEFPDLDFYATDRETTFCHLKWRFDAKGALPYIYSNLTSVISAFPESKENNSTHNNEYVDDEGYQCIMPNGTLYSLDDIVHVLKLGARTIDRELRRLERETSPENRYAYLILPPSVRDLASTWFYYDLGVTDPGKIFKLKEANVTDVDEIRTYAQLPDEMFHEIIALRHK